MSERERSISSEPKAGISIREGAVYMGVCVKTFREYVRKKIVETYPVGKRQRRVTREAIDAARLKLRMKEESKKSADPTERRSHLSPLSGKKFLRTLK